MSAPDDGEHTTDAKRDREAKYYKRRSAEAVLLVKRELQTAAARSLAVNPDGKEADFVELAREVWREAVGDVACNSNEDHPSLKEQRCSYGGASTPSACRLPAGHTGLHERFPEMDKPLSERRDVNQGEKT